MGRANRPHVYMKIAAESGVGKKLQEFIANCNEVSETARQWAEKQGASSYYESPDGFAGGVAMVEFENTISKAGWKNIQQPGKEGYEPTPYFVPEEGSELEKEMLALPMVNETDLIGTLQFKPKVAKDKDGNAIKDKDGKEKPLPFSFGDVAPAVFLHHGYYYTDVPYESMSDDCQVITEKEFLRRRMACMNENN